MTYFNPEHNYIESHTYILNPDITYFYPEYIEYTYLHGIPDIYILNPEYNYSQSRHT